MNDEFNINFEQTEEESEVIEENIPEEDNSSKNNTNFNSFFGFSSYEEYLEQEKFKKISRTVGYCFLISYALIIVFNFVLSFFSTLFRGSNFVSYLGDPAVNQVIGIIFSLFVYIPPFVLIAKGFKFKISDIALLKKPEKGNRLTLFLIGISFCSFANIAVNYAASIFEGFGIEYNVDFGENPKGIFGFLLTMIATMAVPALIEEFAVRGIALGILRKFGDSFAILTSSVLFALMHRNFQQIPFAFLVGLVLAYITIKTNSIWISVAVHAFNNGTAVLLEFLTEKMSNMAASLTFNLFFMATLVLGIVAFLVSDKNKDLFEIEKANTIMAEGKKIKKFMLCFPVVLFTIVCIIEAIGYFFV
jgi:membrane protease YdiL (CAAX protease family)